MARSSSEHGTPRLTVAERWTNLLEGEGRSAFQADLIDVLRANRWFGGKARSIRSSVITETLPIPFPADEARLLLVHVHYSEGDSETYAMFLAFARGPFAAQLSDQAPRAILANLRVDTADGPLHGLLYDPLWNPDFTHTLLRAINDERDYPGDKGYLHASKTSVYPIVEETARNRPSSVIGTEQSNTSVVMGEDLVLKLYRRMQEGMNPDLELSRFLTERGFPNVPPVWGSIAYVPVKGAPSTLTMLQRFVSNQGDAWAQALQSIEPYFERIVRERPAMPEWAESRQPILALASQNPPQLVVELIGSYVPLAERLGQRTAELHAALAQDEMDPAFSPEPISPSYKEARFKSMSRLVEQHCALLETRLAGLPEEARSLARTVLERKPQIGAGLQGFLDLRTRALRIRCHGDYHLGQLLWTGHDYMIIDFEGEPARPLSERRLKHSPLLDVAGMLRSFHYAAHVALARRRADKSQDPVDLVRLLGAWAEFWAQWVSVAFLRSYIHVAAPLPFWPESPDEAGALLQAYLLEKAAYEVGYELNNRPDWVTMPLRGIVRILASHN